MKDIEGGLLFILLIAFAGIHGEMMFSGLGWNISREATNDPWSAQCVYYYNASLFTLKSAIGNPCPPQTQSHFSHRLKKLHGLHFQC
jgi:hypothetical protein